MLSPSKTLCQYRDRSIILLGQSALSRTNGEPLLVNLWLVAKVKLVKVSSPCSSYPLKSSVLPQWYYCYRIAVASSEAIHAVHLPNAEELFQRQALAQNVVAIQVEGPSSGA
jgi:hypothetical protein